MEPQTQHHISFYAPVLILLAMSAVGLIAWGVKRWLASLITHDGCQAHQFKCRQEFMEQINETYEKQDDAEVKVQAVTDRLDCIDDKMRSIQRTIYDNREQVIREVSSLRVDILKEHELFRREISACIRDMIKEIASQINNRK